MRSNTFFHKLLIASLSFATSSVKTVQADELVSTILHGGSLCVPHRVTVTETLYTQDGEWGLTGGSEPSVGPQNGQGGYGSGGHPNNAGVGGGGNNGASVTQTDIGQWPTGAAAESAYAAHGGTTWNGQGGEFQFVFFSHLFSRLDIFLGYEQWSRMHTKATYFF